MPPLPELTGGQTIPLALLFSSLFLLVGGRRPAYGRISRRAGIRSGNRHRRATGLVLAAAAAAAVGAVWFVRASVVAASLLVVVTGVHVFDRYTAARRKRAVDRAVTEMLSVAAAALTTGGTVADAMSVAAAHVARAPQPVVAAIRAAARAAALGRDGAAELVSAAHTSPQLAAAGRLWRLAATHGIAVADLYRTLAQALEADQRHRAEQQAALAGPKTSAGVLAALPLAGIGLGSMLGADPVGFLLGSGTGAVCLVTGTALACAGVLTAGVLVRRAERGQS